MDELLIFSVSEVSFHLKQVVETQLEHLYVRGEISNFTHHSSGHMYFSIKDERSTLRCTFFLNANLSLDFVPENGLEVVCFGKMTIYDKGGTYNLNVLQMSISGKGDLQRRFEQLKAKLIDEGLFDQVHKRPLPRYPGRIGIVTSPTGAALQDILNVLSRRFPVDVIVYPVVVQGNDAPAQLVAGIKYFNDIGSVDLIILARGGGSQEDLFCFNDETLARMIFASHVPIISAVGHEIDYTISDFVADLRAPTPSAAAEIAVPDKKDVLSFLASVSLNLNQNISRILSLHRERLTWEHQQLARTHPLSYVQNLQQRLDFADVALSYTTRVLNISENRITLTSSKLTSAIAYSAERLSMLKALSLPHLADTLQTRFRESISTYTHKLNTLETKLELLSPKAFMDKGYSLIISDGHIIRSVTELNPGEEINILLGDGSVDATVQSITPN